MERRSTFWSTYVVILQQRDAMDPTQTDDRERGNDFLPRFDGNGLIGAIVQHAQSRDVLMFAYMDAEALARTRDSGLAHFHSRSRGKLWLKGETSGHVLRVREIRVDCDQDALVLLVDPTGPACHTGAPSCFYRRLNGEGLASASD
jgi:phosphoribosyl-AMP cyclohydrolase